MELSSTVLPGCDVAVTEPLAVSTDAPRSRELNALRSLSVLLGLEDAMIPLSVPTKLDIILCTITCHAKIASTSLETREKWRELTVVTP